MRKSVTIVMYHYVRDLKHSRYPAIKGLSVDRFCRQLDHIQANYTPISVEQLLSAQESDEIMLPRNPILLTFDDGYSDHFLNAFPLLDSRGIQGCFFPPAQAIVEHRVLDVNKIQFVLATISDPDALLDRCFSIMEEFRANYELKTREEYLLMVSDQHRYDPHVVHSFKRLLQHLLPEPVRAEIVRRLFVEYVTEDEADFAYELYMSIEQISCMRHHGMHIGSHGYAHEWLNHISPDAQATEIDRSLEFLQSFGVQKDNWTMCYPYGGFNDSLLQILRERNCRLGFTVEARAADLKSDDRLLLPRIDTNDLPS
jgi:peptidoglycan/xylan/chitin deacetylase (PgdA/CDA1 family)